MAESVVATSSHSQSSVSRIAARIAFVASAMFILLLAALHILRPDLDPAWRFISEYELGDYGWVMRVAFISLSLSCFNLCVALSSQVRGVAGYLGLALVLLAAVGMAIAGIFAPDRVNKLHEVGAMLDHLPFGALLVNWSLSRNAAWRPARRMLLCTAGIPLLGLVIFVASMVTMLPRNGGQPGPEVLVGWPNRLMILAHCAWLMPVAWYTITLSSWGTTQGSSSPS